MQGKGVYQNLEMLQTLRKILNGFFNGLIIRKRLLAELDLKKCLQA